MLQLWWRELWAPLLSASLPTLHCSNHFSCLSSHSPTLAFNFSVLHTFLHPPCLLRANVIHVLCSCRDLLRQQKQGIFTDQSDGLSSAPTARSQFLVNHCSDTGAHKGNLASARRQTYTCSYFLYSAWYANTYFNLLYAHKAGKTQCSFMTLVQFIVSSNVNKLFFISRSINQNEFELMTCKPMFQCCDDQSPKSSNE